MAERETDSDDLKRRGSVIDWMLAIAVSFALGALVTNFALLEEPISQISLQAFFMSPYWATASIALAGFILGLGFAFVPFSWYRQDANRALRAEYRALRDKADALREKSEAMRDRMETLRAREPARAAQPEEPEPPYAVQSEGPQDIASVISEMSAAIKANLHEAGSKSDADGKPAPRPKLFDE
jgi:hypothetical protein